MLETRSARLLDEDVATALVEAASAAPSVHNSQPWIFTVGERTVDLHADPARHLAVSDGSGRSLLISCGAALFNLRVAADHLGFHPRVRILPTQGRPDPRGPARGRPPARLARVPGGPVPGRLVATYQPLPVLEPPDPAVGAQPAAGRGQPRELPAADRRPARGGRADRGAAARRRAGRPARGQAGAGGLGGPRRRARRHPLARAGPPPAGPVHPVPRPPGRRPGRDGRPRRPGGEPRTAPFETTPTVAILSTLKDTPADWVRAGQALERSLLVATAEGLSASFMNQPLEHHDLRWQVRSPLTGVGVTQMIMRIGYGIPVPATPRRPVAEVMRQA